MAPSRPPASTAWPPPRSRSCEAIKPPLFLRLLSAGEVATGALLLAPFVSNRKAGLALTAFSGGLMTLYARTPSMREPGSIWPSQQGMAVAKDVWMLGVGLGLLLDPATKAKPVAAVSQQLRAS